VPICSNCDHLKIYYGGKLWLEADPDRRTFPHLKYPPFLVSLINLSFRTWDDLRIDGYIDGKLAASRTISGNGTDERLVMSPDDTELDADGRDATRLVLAVTDAHGNLRPFATGAVQVVLTGPAQIVGENPFALTGGAGAVWVKAQHTAGTVRIQAHHPYLGTAMAEIRLRSKEPEWL
jgi:beta-galactosidase